MRIILAAIAAAISVPAAAAEFTVQLSGEQGRLIRGKNGLHAADSRTSASLVRVISPGIPINKRGTVRVLVMNLGQPAFRFGPGHVQLVLPDGSVLTKVPLKEFAKGAELVSTEMRRAAAVDARVKAGLSTLAESAAMGMTAQVMTGSSAGSGSAASGSAFQQDRKLDADQLPGARLLAAIDGVLQPNSIAPQEATGGYLVFELPKSLRSTRADAPITIVVTAGSEEHRFNALLKRR
jgi:hypothetical protein